MFTILIDALNIDNSIKKYKVYKTILLLFLMIIGIVILTIKYIYDFFNI
jgi:hypothetical protein